MIPLVDLKAQYRSIKQEIDKALQETLDSGHFIHGIQTREFEKEFAVHLGARFCVGVNSGTDALILGIRALGLQAGDEIILPANTHIAAAEAILENRLTPVFVDVEEHDFGIDLEDLVKKISPKTRAVIVVHLFGKPEKLEEIQEILNDADQKIHLIEDASHAAGASYKEKKVGTFGTFAAFSFSIKID